MKPVLRDVLAVGGPGRSKRRFRPAEAAALPAVPARVEVLPERAVLEQLERQAADLRQLQSLVGELAVERRGEQEALTAVAREFRRLHERQEVLRLDHEDALEAESMARAEVVAAGATIVALRDQLLATRAELHTERARHLQTEGELVAARHELARVTARLARTTSKLQRCRAELQDARRRRRRHGRPAARDA